MEGLTVISRCGDGSCFFIPQRSMIALISIISLVACILDMITTNGGPTQCPENLTLLCAQVDCAKQLLITLFQMANLLLLLASIVERYTLYIDCAIHKDAPHSAITVLLLLLFVSMESAILVQLYVWYTLAFVVLGLIVNILDFLFKYKLEGTSCLIGFITEVCFLFAISRCLPLVDTYRKHIGGESSITS